MADNSVQINRNLSDSTLIDVTGDDYRAPTIASVPMKGMIFALMRRFNLKGSLRDVFV